MSAEDREQSGQPEQPGHAESAWERKRRLARIFGDGLPETTTDERDDSERGTDAERGSDAWLRAQVPPHHGS
jgi:hypothetical protein